MKFQSLPLNLENLETKSVHLHVHSCLFVGSVEEEVRARIRYVESVFNDATKMAGWFHEDGILMRGGDAPVVGREGREYVCPFFNPSPKCTQWICFPKHLFSQNSNLTYNLPIFSQLKL